MATERERSSVRSQALSRGQRLPSLVGSAALLRHTLKMASDGIGVEASSLLEAISTLPAIPCLLQPRWRTSGSATLGLQLLQSLLARTFELRFRHFTGIDMARQLLAIRQRFLFPRAQGDACSRGCLGTFGPFHAADAVRVALSLEPSHFLPESCRTPRFYGGLLWS
ncbi:hypothetical protein MRF4_15135 [Methylobacterium radiotolerans]|uniref:Uncharacterized protein n=1 Tax=Methylobacterium oryzae TaxID=334852 RepID=A0ABU7TLK2_9HYPH